MTFDFSKTGNYHDGLTTELSRNMLSYFEWVIANSTKQSVTEYNPVCVHDPIGTVLVLNFHSTSPEDFGRPNFTVQSTLPNLACLEPTLATGAKSMFGSPLLACAQGLILLRKHEFETHPGIEPYLHQQKIDTQVWAPFVDIAVEHLLSTFNLQGSRPIATLSEKLYVIEQVDGFDDELFGVGFTFGWPVDKDHIRRMMATWQAMLHTTAMMMLELRDEEVAAKNDGVIADSQVPKHVAEEAMKSSMDALDQIRRQK
jgi:hypothetical protein